jgi:transcriptional regulator with XRE-family HTH domain
MEQTKRKRLEAAGWQAGSAADFVGLNYEEAAYVELRVRLSDALKARRLASHLSQKAVAAALTSSQSRVAKMEAADPSVSLDLLIRGLIALGVSLAELGRIMGFDEREIVTIKDTAAATATVLGQPVPIQTGRREGASNAG